MFDISVSLYEHLCHCAPIITQWFTDESYHYLIRWAIRQTSQQTACGWPWHKHNCFGLGVFRMYFPLSRNLCALLAISVVCLAAARLQVECSLNLGFCGSSCSFEGFFFMGHFAFPGVNKKERNCMYVLSLIMHGAVCLACRACLASTVHITI